MWRTTLRDLIRTGAFQTQSALVEALADAGHEVTQGTVSRELSDLGVEKADGIYRLPTADLGAPVHDVQVTSNGCLAVVKTDSAFASVVGNYIDSAGIDGVLGTIAGDDTVFVALRDSGAADRLRDEIRRRR